ncbi:MAG: PEP-utilizing enzyme [Candidatus Magasanikbacteria bacterium]
MNKEKNNLPFDPNGNIFHWGPVPGKFFYCSAFTKVHYEYFRAKYNENWSETLWLFQNNRMLWINDLDDLRAAGLKVFLKYLLPKETHENIYTEWQGCVQELSQIEKRINNVDFSSLSNEELKRLWHEFHDAYIKFWVAGSVPEVGNYGIDKYFENKLKPFILNETELPSAMEILTAPTRLSFYQEEEIALSKATDMHKHQQEYFWLKNSYAGTEILPVEFFLERKKELQSNIEDVMNEKIKQVAERKKDVQKKYNLSQEVMNIAYAISDGIGWQDERKKYIFIVLHYQDILLKEVIRRFEYTLDDLHNAWYFEIEQIIDGKDLKNLLAKRKEGFGVRFFHECEELSPEQTDYFWKLYDTKVEQDISEVKGIVASKGKGGIVRGRIHILLDPSKADTFKDGEILVAPMTSPEYVFVMKKSCAVITDTGGLTSHAAIVSRELNIPCIVGTKNASKVFRDGDVVEVNGNTGIVRKI